MKRAGSSESSTFKKTWIAKADEDYTTAHQDFLAELEGFAGTLTGPNGTYYFNFEDYTAKHLGNGYWEVEATYRTVGGGEQSVAGAGGGGGGGSTQNIGVIQTISFDTTGGSRRITQAYDEIAFGSNPPNQNKAINVKGEDVEGCDIVVPVFEWQEDYEIPGAKLTQSYVNTIANLTGKVNDSTFRGFDEGEVLFLGCSGSQTFNPNQANGSAASSARLSFRFAQSPNETNLDVGGISVALKKGWHFMWTVYDATEDAASRTVLKKPRFVYVNEVYETGDFSTLRLP